ncbi:MAG: VanZ family protein [Bacteroidota bacterium]
MLPAVWAAFILLLTLMPGSSLPSLTFMDAFRPDKVAHFVVFAIQALLLITAFIKHNPRSIAARHTFIAAPVLSSVFGMLIELAQTTVPGRSYELADLLADSLGALLGIPLFILIYRVGA